MIYDFLLVPIIGTLSLINPISITKTHGNSYMVSQKIKSEGPIFRWFFIRSRTTKMTMIQRPWVKLSKNKRKMKGRSNFEVKSLKGIQLF